jgi:pheromone shutdown protein TraB
LNKGVESNNSSAKFVYYILDTVFSRINGLKNGSTTQRLNELGALKQNTFMTNQALTNLQKILNDQVGIEINNTFKNALDAINAHVVIVTNDA